jgi:hypothetical protein
MYASTQSGFSGIMRSSWSTPSTDRASVDVRPSPSVREIFGGGGGGDAL